MPLLPNPLPSHDTLFIAILGGSIYAVGVLLWAFTTGIHFTSDNLQAIVIAGGYAAFGMFLIAAIPLYLLGRLSLVSPLLIAAWSLGNTIYLRWYVPRPHDALASYLTVWPLFIGLIGIAAIIELAVRTGTDRIFGRFPLRSLLE